MDYVYIVKDGSNEELRYSIRSVVKNMPAGNIWVVGGKPDWYSGNHIPIPQNLPKYHNAIANLLAACKSNEISEDFVLMNDDFFILQSMDQIPTYHGGSFLDKVQAYTRISPTSTYTKRLAKTSQRLRKLGVMEQKDYDIHVPMIMNKQKLLKILKFYPECLWRSMYGNIHNLGGIEISDIKVYSLERMQERSYDYISGNNPYVSSDNGSFEILYLDLLKDNFSKESPYESY